MKGLRRYTVKFFVILFLLLMLTTICIYYSKYSTTNEIISGQSALKLINPPSTSSYSSHSKNHNSPKSGNWVFENYTTTNYESSRIDYKTCSNIELASTNIDTVEEFSKFQFQPFWLRNREFWDENFEQRYKEMKSKGVHLPLKVIVVPHSHNDPGWLKTFEGYYHSQTRNILNHMVDKLTTLPNMTFIWSEISFLAQWWEGAHPTRKRVLEKLLQQGRLEIVTGGWVMTDEATTHIYGMLDQLIEGHQWIRTNLGLDIKTGWSVDPFGHGPTMPYLLKSSGITDGTVIQRIHYAWKQWLAYHQNGDFYWRQNWDPVGYTDMLTHNLPYDIYSIKHSCGPHPQICLNFDFRKVIGEYTEYTLKAVPIDKQNVRQKAELLLEQYRRTGSLFPHNVVLVPLGDDFRYEHDIEWEQQYRNYKRLFDYINNRQELYNADISFGTPIDYFREVQNRLPDLKTLKGDFFVYSDIFSEGRPAYWSGYFTTRPYWKILDRELESNLRSAEILYTVALNVARFFGNNNTIKLFERDYEKLSRARQNLGVFQHHDAITGTSKSFVMRDYTLKLTEGIQDSLFIQSISAEFLLSGGSRANPNSRIILPDTDLESYDKISQKIVLTVHRTRRILIFNSLAQTRQEIIKILISTPYVRVIDPTNNRTIIHQLNPVWNMSNPNKNSPPYFSREQQQPLNLDISKTRYELLFVVELPPLSLNIFKIEPIFEKNATFLSTIYCQSCQKNGTIFQTQNIQPGDIQLENSKLRALFDGKTAFLKTITRKKTEKRTHIEMSISAYQSAQFHSGAYLFMPDPNLAESERDVLKDYPSRWIIITTGFVASEVTVFYENILLHTARIYHTDGPLSEGIYIENVVDFEAPPKNRETELFMRFSSSLDNGAIFYTDSNGMQMQKRKTLNRVVGIEANYYPITSQIYIEDSEQRLSLLVNHAQGGAAWQPGWLEVMLDRRTLYDDARGMGEGIVDNKRTLTKYWLLLEEKSRDNSREDDVTSFSRPSLLSNYLSNGLLYPANVYFIEEQSITNDNNNRLNRTTLPLISKSLPCDVHLMNFRTTTDPTFTQFPAKSSLMILHRQGFACDVSDDIKLPNCPLQETQSEISESKSTFYNKTVFYNLPIKNLFRTTLTGLKKLKQYNDFSDVRLSPMNLLTLNVTFNV